MNLAIVTATTDPHRALPCLMTWQVPESVPLIIVTNSDKADRLPTLNLDARFISADRYLGSVPAFRVGVDYALESTQADIIICLHDDVKILQSDWLEVVTRNFERRPQCGLAGFGGAIGLGADDIYQTKYNPMQLARIGFRSNLVNAESHGIRSLLAERVACLDGFSQIGRREFFYGQFYTKPNVVVGGDRPWTYLEHHGVVHHAYDGMLGCLAARYGWQTWYLPVRCEHLGGQTAVLDRGYQAWAQSQILGGDMGYWEQSHRRFFELCKDVLPLRV